jgi:hypothetical protein
MAISIIFGWLCGYVLSIYLVKLMFKLRLTSNIEKIIYIAINILVPIVFVSMVGVEVQETDRWALISMMTTVIYQTSKEAWKGAFA